MIAFAGGSILQAAVALAVAAVLARAWNLRNPDQRLPYHLLILAVPLVVHPALFLLAPFRRSPWFQDRLGLLTLASWDRLQIGGLPLPRILVPLAAATGLFLFLRDLVSAVATRLPVAEQGALMEAGAAEKVAAAAAAVACDMRLPKPDLLLLDDAEPQILCRGMRRPRLVVSRGAVERLSPEELRAALAHELAHQEQGDLRTGWLLLALRALLFFNPVAQGIGRQALQDFEHRADDRAAEVTGDPLVVASALVHLARAEASHFPASSSSRGDFLHIEARGRRLLEHGVGSRVSLPGPRLVVTAVSVALLSFFIV